MLKLANSLQPIYTTPMRIKSAEFVKGIKGTDPILYDGVPEYAFVGRSNVGKSSVINALLNKKDLVRVGKMPGKTREVNFFRINNQVYFVDLPGYGYATAGPEEKEKIKKLILWYLMYSEVEHAKVVLILDAKVGFTEFDSEMVRALKQSHRPFVIVANKIDKLNQKETKKQMDSIAEKSGVDVFPYSAKNRKGTDILLNKILS